MEKFNIIFRAFLKEALFTKEMLGLGATQIRRAGYTSKGLYYEAFTCLSTGFERIGKLCLILDYYISNNGMLPTFNYMKKEIGHDLIKLYNKASAAVKKHDITFRFLKNLDDDIYQRILRILSDFALGDRYSNINILSQSPQKNDPVSSWFYDIDTFIFENYVTDKKKLKINANASLINMMTANYVYVLHISETGENITNIESVLQHTAMQEAVAPYRQLFILQMIRYWVELIEKLGFIAQKINLEKLEIPYFSEIFMGFFNEDSYFKSRKTWDTI